MSTFSSGEPDMPGPGIREALRLARKHAAAMKAQEVTPEHLLLGLVEQGDSAVIRALGKADIDASALRLRVEQLFGAYSDSDLRGDDLPMSREVQECLSWARSFAGSKIFPMGPVPPVLLMIALLRTKQIQTLLIPILPTLKSILASLLRDAWSIKPADAARLTYEAIEALPLTPYTASLYNEPDKPTDQWSTIEQRYTPGQIVSGVVTRIASFGAFARIEDGIEGLIHQSELPVGVDPKTVRHEGAQLQLRILRIDAERRRLGLSLRDIPAETTSETLCPSCKRAVPSSWKHCTFCGTELAKTCPNCGASYPDVEDARFCFECGHQLE